MSTKAAAAADLARAGLGARGLSREQAAAYVGVSATMFDSLVRDRVMPPAKKLGSRRIWDRYQLDKAFAALPDENGDAHADDIWSKLA